MALSHLMWLIVRAFIWVSNLQLLQNGITIWLFKLVNKLLLYINSVIWLFYIYFLCFMAFAIVFLTFFFAYRVILLWQAC